LDDSAPLVQIVNHPQVLAALQTVLNDFALQGTGSSTWIKRAVFADFQLSMEKGEITDKGSINQGKVLSNYSDWVDRIYATTPSGTILETNKA
jgi:feruloyl-CoA synthase